MTRVLFTDTNKAYSMNGQSLTFSLKEKMAKTQQSTKKADTNKIIECKKITFKGFIGYDVVLIM